MTSVMAKRDARKLDRKTQEEIRRLAVKRVLAGEKQRAVAESLEVSPSALYIWMAKYRDKGDAALARRKAPGRAPVLSKRERERLRRTIVARDPRQLQFPFALWTLPLIGELIVRLFGVVLHKTTVSRMLHAMGLTPQRPVRRAFSRDEEECRRWAEEEFPAIVRQFAAGNRRCCSRTRLASTKMGLSTALGVSVADVRSSE